MERFTSFDFGLSGLAGLFHQDWTHLGNVEEVVLSYLSVGEESFADEAQQKESTGLASDVVVLADSILAGGQIEMLFSMASGGNYPFRNGETGRVLLERIQGAFRYWQQMYGGAPVEADPKWSSPGILTEVRSVINHTPLNLPEECRVYFDSDAQKLRDVLDSCARHASPELAFRILLRIHLSNFIPVEQSSWSRYKIIAAELSLGEELVSAVEFLAH
ncbi:hypothetical protein [Streptomyces sp. RKAG293]|uniref:hypothetical protein n=1 Tax=Streptomyces sp. RKAG293 TaxID=2893403 RepID=UPI00203391A7|nr:hypothetical protein [Streptomyces sp. RKAG293]MCM2419871.1 hypothetical protein [Streptomyces sp. RKAG293]